MTDRSLAEDLVRDTRSAEDPSSPSETATGLRVRKENIQGGEGEGEAPGWTGDGWHEHVPIERGGKSRFRWVGDLTLLFMGIGTVIVTLVAVGIGFGVWLRQWQGWSPAVVTGLITSGGLTMLGWGLSRE